MYTDDKGGRIGFRRLPAPDDAEVARVTACVARRTVRLLERRGLGPTADPDDADPLLRDQPLLAELYRASVQGRIATGADAGNRITVFGAPIEEESVAAPSVSRCAAIWGFSLHANVCLPAKARRALENLCRYAARPPVATERLSLLPDGRVAYRLRHHWRDGTTHVLLDPLELVGKLAALVPPRRFNLVRYHGILAAGAAWRRQVIPVGAGVEGTDRAAHPGCNASGKILCPAAGRAKGQERSPRPQFIGRALGKLDTIEETTKQSE